MHFVGHTAAAPRRPVGMALFSFAIVMALLCAAFLPLARAQAAAAPAGRTAAASAQAPGQLKAVIVVGPTHSSTTKYLGLGESLAQNAEAMGMDVRRIFHPQATAERLLNNIQGANFVAYFGHGNGWPSPYAPFQERTKDGMGLNPVGGGSASQVEYYGANWFRNNVRLADNAVVLLRGLCYAEGNGEPGMATPSWDVARQRVDNFAAGFLFIGAGAVFAYGWQNIDSFLTPFMTTDQTIDEIFMTRGKSASPLYGFIGWDHRYFDSQRMPGFDNHLDPSSSEGYLRAVSGRMNMTTTEFRGGGGGVEPTPTPSTSPTTSPTPTATVTPVPPPTTPQGFTATAQPNGTVQMAWQPSTASVPGTLQYRVFRNGNAIGSKQTTLTYTDQPAAGTHKYKVRAIDASGVTSYFSNIVSVTVAGAVASPTPTPSPTAAPSPTPTASLGPTVPQGLTATPDDDGAVELTWQASTSNSTGTMRYRVFRNGSAIGSKQTARSYTDFPGVTGSVKYQVRAIDGAGRKSALSPFVTVQVEDSVGASGPDTTAPSKPQGLTATALGDRRVGLSWSASTDDSGGPLVYRVFRNKRLVAKVSATSYTDRPAAAGTYKYRVKAVDAAGNRSSFSTAVWVNAV
jgi:hypothetical protein